MTDKRARLGTLTRCSVSSEEPYFALIPRALPPKDLDLGSLQTALEKANQALGRLDGVASLLDTNLFLYMYVRKEAVLSSQIEGTQSSLSDLLLYESEEAPGVSLNDVQEVSNYVAALNHGLKRLNEGFPLSMRLIKEMHTILMTNARGGSKDPGEFRRTQNWVGGSRPGTATYVPPPPESVLNCMSDLEKYLHQTEDNLPILVKAGLVHHQFETIHPFLDGNGRLGRLLITLLLCSNNVLTEPLLYLSLYFKVNRAEYYALLQEVRENGDWEKWLRFFIKGVYETASQASETAKELLNLVRVDREKIMSIGKGTNSALQVHHFLQRKPLVVISELVASTKLSTPTVTSAIQNLGNLGMVREITGKTRGKIFVYDSYLNILQRGTEPL